MTNEYICVLLIQEFSLRMSSTNGHVCVCTIVRVCVNVIVCASASSLTEVLDYLHMYYIAAGTDTYTRMHNTRNTNTHTTHTFVALL